MPMSRQALGSLIWILIFGGGLLGSLGVFLVERSRVAGTVAIVLGLAAIVCGVALIGVHSRRPKD